MPMPAHTVKEILKQLESLANEKTHTHNIKYGATENQFGVKHGDIRTLAKKLATQTEIAMPLWETGNADAQLLAALLFKAASLTAAEMNTLVRTVNFSHVADWLCAYVLKHHKDKEKLRLKWSKEKNRWAARAYWALTAERVVKQPEDLDLPALLDRIQAEMLKADPAVQWTMNTTLAEIGIHFPKLRKRAIAIGEALGIYRDYPVSKGCTSPFAPIWIAAIAARNK
jgi:3-methyladenine DNA glycosylase AlkD